MGANCPYFKHHAPEAVVSFHDSIVGPPALLGKTVPGGTIGGQQVLLTDVRHRGGTYVQTLAVPAEQFYVSVRAERLASVNRIVESAQEVPAGYTAVPPLRGESRPAALRAFSKARLASGPDMPKGVDYVGPPVVIDVRPDTGTVVPIGTRVRLQFG
jgi:hypothetical protein